MEVWESNDYELLNSPLAGELKFEDITQSTNYLEWINWDQKMVEKTDKTVPASNSSDSGLSSDFHYDQQLSPCKCLSSCLFFSRCPNLYVIYLHYGFKTCSQRNGSFYAN